ISDWPKSRISHCQRLQNGHGHAEWAQEGFSLAESGYGGSLTSGGTSDGKRGLISRYQQRTGKWQKANEHAAKRQRCYPNATQTWFGLSWQRDFVIALPDARIVASCEDAEKRMGQYRLFYIYRIRSQ